MKRITSTLSQKWPEYILEILVLIIGIFGAFELDSWNDHLKQLKGKEDYLERLLSNYNSNLSQLEQKINLHEVIIGSGFSIIKDFDDPQNLDTATLMINLRRVAIDPTFDPTMHDTQNSEYLSLVKDKELVLLLTNWSSDIIALREMELSYSKVVYEQYLPVLSQMGVFREVAGYFWDDADVNNEWLLGTQGTNQKTLEKPLRKVEVEQLIKNKNLEGLVTVSIVMNQGALEQAYALKEKIELTIELLKVEKQL